MMCARLSEIPGGRQRLIEYLRYSNAHPTQMFVRNLLKTFDAKPDDVETQLFSEQEFGFLNLKPEVRQGLEAAGYRKLTKLQETILPDLLVNDGRNMTIHSHSGSGKTLAMAILMTNKVNVQQNVPQIVFVTATIELAVQIANTVVTISRHLPLHQPTIRLAVPGENVVMGIPIDEQIIIGTPKELASYRILGAFDVSKIRLAIFDEYDIVVTTDLVDRHLVKAFSEAQIVCLSATSGATNIGGRVITLTTTRYEQVLKNLSVKFMKCHDVMTKLDKTTVIIDGILRKFHSVVGVKIIIFCNKRSTANWLSRMLKLACYEAFVVTGETSFDERLLSLYKFGQGSKPILITTNLLARGLDVSTVKLVLNFDLPTNASGKADTKMFLHRIGRAGRFGRKAAAVSLVLDTEIDIARQIGIEFGRQVKLN